MAVEAGASLTEVLAALVPIIGSGGLVGGIIAWLGYRKAALEARKPALDVPAQLGLGVIYAEAAAVQAVGHGVERLAAAVERLAHAVDGLDGSKLEQLLDEFIKLRRAAEDAAAKRPRGR